jgi:predicted transcriptional regulator
MPATKSMTLRLAPEKAAELEQIARADAVPVSDAVRSAIEEHIERRRSDAKFQARLKRMIEEDREVLERLAQ